ncbi:MAG: group 1 truncated hemoglobin, partial [Nitrospinota bacterium]
GFGLRPVTAGEQSPKTLYERLGGVGPIAVVVDDFLNRLYPNPVLNANPAIDAARKQVPSPALKFLVTQYMCHATGGPCSYEGRSMKEAHKALKITEVEWQAMMANFRETLFQFKVPKREQQELIALLESVKGDIVIAAK